MYHNYLLFCLVGVLGFFTASTVARHAIIEGDKAMAAPLRYQISLKIEGKGHVCGGGIIGEEFILTAAHCIIKKDGHFDKRPMEIIAGTFYMHKTASPAVKSDVKKIYVPREYSPKHPLHLGDIAILKLVHPLPLSTHVNLKKLELPKDPRNNYAGKIVKIGGFGWNNIIINGGKVLGGSTDGYLRYADAAVISPGQHGYPVANISEKQLCARVQPRQIFKPRGVCYGDSGSPLVHFGTTVIGVLSVSPWDCSERDVSAIYTRVTSYLHFINNSMNDVHHDIVTYTFP